MMYRVILVEYSIISGYIILYYGIGYYLEDIGYVDSSKESI